MRLAVCALTTLCLTACATASPAPGPSQTWAPPTPAPAPKPIPPSCRAELLTPPARPEPLPLVVSVRDALSIGAADGVLALANAILAGELQTCVRDLVAQREDARP